MLLRGNKMRDMLAVGAVMVTGMIGLASTPTQADTNPTATFQAAAPVLDELLIITELAEPALPEAFVAAAPVMEQLFTITRGELYHEVTLFFATNRAERHVANPSTPADKFTTRMGPVSYGIAEVSIPKDHKVGHLESQSWGSALFFEPNPTKHVILQSMDVQDDDDVIAQLQSIMDKDGSSTLFYIHGFNVGVDTAARRAGQLTFDLNWKGPSFFFSWPSLDRGDPFAYNADQETARDSRPALEAVLERVAATDTDRIVIIAHSMGTDLLAQALELMEARDSAALAKIETVILAAPDIRASIFQNSIVPAIEKIQQENEKFTVTVYASANDSALQLSDGINGRERVGIMSTITDAQRAAFHPVLMVDASAAETNFFGHTYINDNPSVIGDVYCMLAKGPDPTKRASLLGVPVPAGPGFKIANRVRNDTLDNEDGAPQFDCD